MIGDRPGSNSGDASMFQPGSNSDLPSVFENSPSSVGDVKKEFQGSTTPTGEAPSVVPYMAHAGGAASGRDMSNTATASAAMDTHLLFPWAFRQEIGRWPSSDRELRVFSTFHLGAAPIDPSKLCAHVITHPGGPAQQAEAMLTCPCADAQAYREHATAPFRNVEPVPTVKQMTRDGSVGNMVGQVQAAVNRAIIQMLQVSDLSSNIMTGR